MKTTKLPRKVLIDALAGEDVCPHCRGRGWIAVTNRSDRRACPPCRGTGLAPFAHTMRRTEHKANREVRS